MGGRPAERPPEGKSDGLALYERLKALIAALPEPPPIRLNGIECMSGCNHPCTVALAAPGKPTTLIGGFQPAADDAERLLALAGRYLDSETGSLTEP